MWSKLQRGHSGGELWKSGGVVTQGRRLKSNAPPSPALTLRDFASEPGPSGSGAECTGCLQRNGDGKPDVRIAAIVEVVSIVVVDVNVIGAIPVCRPVFRIRIDQQERVPAVPEARISHVHNGAGSHAEEVPAAETEIEGGLRNVVTAVASALLPGAMVGRPVSGAILLPGVLRLPTAALLYPSPLLLP